eukprot:CAMPEP_0202978186 /NCGR_PEP_ID=MMETSP1396-20130829/84693_1 /ASSEMBLY_ACC=CAM_ASM_000872 /TAXON_ID= /ORGANISM="Pseudokeronopsis sp., Strain Brazil" /LENGTH=53 /DNA_ID=CAMNT_0049717073 /DNA_START=401 /DNA_END=562 /DNA_ORIENTATION=-
MKGEIMKEAMQTEQDYSDDSQESEVEKPDEGLLIEFFRPPKLRALGHRNHQDY